MENNKTVEKKLEELKKKLQKHCTQNNLKRIGSFTFMFNEEDGRNIGYVADMDIKKLGREIDFYDRSSPDYNPEHDDIKWPYTGFIQGVAEAPISIHDLAIWLKNSPYLEKSSPLRKNFINYFEELV